MKKAQTDIQLITKSNIHNVCHRTRKSIKLSFILSSILIGAMSLYAEVPTVGDPMQGVEPPIKPKTVPVINIEEKPTQTLPSIDDNRTVYIKKFKVVGNKSLNTDELLALIKPYENKELTMKQLEDVAALITKRYREKGFFVARAYIAQNALTNDTLTITVIRGTYGKIKVDNSSLASNATVQDIFNNLETQAINSNSLERAVMLTNDLAGVDVTSADIMPGADVGTSDFLIKAAATPRFDGYITGDNYGSKYTGLYRATVGANVNSALGIGDKLSIMGMITDSSGLKNGSITYGAPIMSNGLNLSAGYYNTQYALGQDYSNLNAIGNTSAAQATLSYPLIRSKLENLNMSANPQYQLISDKQLGDNIQKRAGLGVFGVDYSNMTDLISMPTSYKANVSYTVGNLDFRDPIDASYNKLTTNTSGTFSKLSTSLTANVSLTDLISTKGVFNAQFATGKKNLDGSQFITIGGAYGVRAYPSTQESGSSGYIYTQELSYALPQVIEKYSHSVSVFYDIGRAFMANSIASNGAAIPFNAQILQDIGIGYQASYNNFFGKIQIAQVIGGVKVAGVPYYATKALFQVGLAW